MMDEAERTKTTTSTSDEFAAHGVPVEYNSSDNDSTSSNSSNNSGDLERTREEESTSIVSLSPKQKKNRKKFLPAEVISLDALPPSGEREKKYFNFRCFSLTLFIIAIIAPLVVISVSFFRDQFSDPLNNFSSANDLSLASRTQRPTPVISESPSQIPTPLSSTTPSTTPSVYPSLYPTSYPSTTPSLYPSLQPSQIPSTSQIPSSIPSVVPTLSHSPTSSPTISLAPSSYPSSSPSLQPSVPPTMEPTVIHSSAPSVSVHPSSEPSSMPSISPTVTPVETIFYVMGDTPYDSGDANKLKKQMDRLPSDAEFVVHVGDINRVTVSNCRRSWYSMVSSILQRSHAPVFIVLGDNDYGDCPSKRSALRDWKRYFLHFDREHWDHDFAVQYQEKRKENMAFFHKDILYLFINIVGGGRDSDWDDIHDDDADWTREQFDIYGDQMRGCVIFGHADPSNSHKDYFRKIYDYTRDFKDQNRECLYIHGDGHRYERKYLGGGMDMIQVNQGKLFHHS